MKQRFVVLGLHKDFVYQRGEIVDKLWIYYFKPDLSNSRLFKGFILTKLDCFGQFDFSDFEQVPGIYNFDYSVVQSQPVLKSVEFVEGFSISEVDDSLLIISAKPAEFETEDKQVKKGISCTYIDSTGYMDSSTMIGYIPSKGWCDKLNLNLFPQVPAYYSVSLGHFNNRRGEAVIKISEPKIVRPFQPVLNQQAA